MTRHEAQRLAHLAALAAMQRDAALARIAEPLRAETMARQALARIARPPLPPDGAQGLWAAHLAHGAWCDQRARDLNMAVARARDAAQAARPAACAAFGRARVLAHLAQRAARDAARRDKT
jgi:hypothetical protein